MNSHLSIKYSGYSIFSLCPIKDWKIISIGKPLLSLPRLSPFMMSDVDFDEDNYKVILKRD